MGLVSNYLLAVPVSYTHLLYDKETTYGYLTYLTYRVEDTLFTWKKERWLIRS